MSTAITDLNASSEDTSHFPAKNPSPICRKNVFKSPIVGSRIDLKIIPTISVDKTEGMKAIPLCTFKSFIDFVSNNARISPNIFLRMVVTIVKTIVFLRILV
jgi:hypothetical protein